MEDQDPSPLTPYSFRERVSSKSRELWGRAPRRSIDEPGSLSDTMTLRVTVDSTEDRTTHPTHDSRLVVDSSTEEGRGPWYVL